jgi:hypothetical protein
MAKFINPALRTTQRDYFGDYQNNPVNIDLCTSIVNIEEPNGYGKNYPIIHFMGIGITWYYGEHGHRIRDKQYNEILEALK